MSKGLIRRLANVAFAALVRSDITHIAGDVTYVAILCRGKVVITIPDIAVIHRLRGASRFLFRLLWLDLPIRRADVVVSISSFTRQEILQEFPWAADKIVVIHTPLLAEYQRKDRSFNVVCPRILHIGTGLNKNLLRVIYALSGVRCRLVIVGSISPEIAELLLASRVDWEHHEGISDRAMLDLYWSADVISFPSLYEGFGMPIVEGQAIGRVVVTSPVASIPEVAGEAAIFVDPYSIGSIREGFLQAIQNRERRQELILRGYLNAARFSIDRVSAAHVDLYQRVLNG